MNSRALIRNLGLIACVGRQLHYVKQPMTAVRKSNEVQCGIFRGLPFYFTILLRFIFSPFHLDEIDFSSLPLVSIYDSF